jgi:hypothetical protein
MRVTRPKRLAAAITAALLSVPLVATTVTSSPAAAVITGNVLSGTASPMWQVNSEVDALAVANGVIYAGGPFTRVRPPGTNAGSGQEVTRNYLAAFNATTGALITTFNVNVNNRVRALAVSPDNTRLYLAGTFTSVGGSTRNRIAAINISNVANGQNGSLITTFNPNANRTVISLDATATTVYAGGDFSTIGGGNRGNIAALNATTGALNTAFNPVLTAPPPSPFATYSPRVNAIEVVPDGSRVLVGGSFNNVDNAATPTGGLVSLNPTNGDVQSWAASARQPINTNCGGRVTDIIAEGTSAYVTAEGDPPGCYEGTYAARISDGQLLWNSACLGASQGLTVRNGVLFKASHQHDCAFTEGGAFGGFVGGTNRDAFLHRYLVGQDVRDGSFVHWYPNTNATSNGGTTSVGPQVMATTPNGIIVGGDFTRVNGANQQGLARFVAGGDTATPEVPGRSLNGDPWPNTPPRIVASMPVTVQPTAANTLTVEFPAVIDVDTGLLTYRIYRDNANTPIATLTARSWPWTHPTLRYNDSGLAAGSTHSYRVSASDGTRTSARSTAVSGTVRTTAPATLATTYSGLTPVSWYRLGETGNPLTDSGSAGSPGSYQGTTSADTGIVTGNGARRLNGSSGYVAGTRALPTMNAFSEAVWFKTTTTRGGVLVAQSDRSTGSGGNTDRVITMDNNGGVVFAMKAGPSSQFGVGTINIRNQNVTWNDGNWHLAVGTYDGNGNAALYVDGWLQGTATGTPFDSTVRANGMTTSYLRAGYADMSGLLLVFGVNFYANKWPLSDFLDGSVDEPAVFNRALTQAQVRDMFAAGIAGR